jgi:hypothetical protein
MVTSTYEHRRNAGDLRIGNKTFEAVRASSTWEISLVTLTVITNA